MTKKIMLIIAITALATTIFTKIGDYAVSSYKHEADSISLKDVCDKADNLRKDVDHIITDNGYRDIVLSDFKKFKEEDAEWKINDANWKGMMSEIAKSNLYYGKIENVDKLMKLSEENKKNVSKKKHE